MKTTIKLPKFINSKSWIEEIINIGLPIDKAYELKTLVLKYEAEAKSYQEVVSNLFKENWVEEDGKYIVKDEEKQKFVSDELKKLDEKDIELEIPEITKEDLKWKEIKTSTLVLLDWLIK